MKTESIAVICGLLGQSGWSGSTTAEINIGETNTFYPLVISPYLRTPIHGYKTKMFAPKKNQYLGARAPERFIDDKYIHRKGRR